MPISLALCSLDMSVELRHLRAFAAIADEGSVTAAARRLAITQPALSRTLAQLERFLGARLVERSTTSLHLSPEGQALLPKVLAALAAVEEVLDPAAVRARPLRVGHAWSGAGPHTTGILREWHRRHPDVPVEVRRIDDRLAGLARGQVDVAFLRGSVEAAGVRTRLLHREPRVAAMPADHRLAGVAATTMAELAAERLVVNPTSGTVSELLWPADARPEVARRVRTVEDWLIAIAAGQGIGLTAASTAELHAHPGVVFVPVGDAPLMAVLLGWREGPGHPARDDFMAVAVEVVGALERG
jgi:DNA-binding transcriptional LysR family regulator